MANRKQSFILYADQKEVIEDLTLEEKGKLLDALFEYAESGEIPEFEDKLLLIAFKMFKVRIEHDNDKYSEICRKRKEAINKRWEIQKNTNEYKCIQSDTNDTDKDKDKDKDKESHEPKGSMRDIKDNILTMPQKGQLEKPLWKTSYDEWVRLFVEAKDELLKDEEFKKSQEAYYPNIDFVKSVYKNFDYWKQEAVWKEVKKKHIQTINPKQRMKNNFDKNKIFLSPRKEEPQKEPTMQERHNAFTKWLADKIQDDNSMIVFHVSLDDFVEMMHKCGGDANKLSSIVLEIIREPVTYEDGLIGAFRKYMEGKR